MRRSKCFVMGAILVTTGVVITTNSIKKRNKEFKPKGKRNDGINGLPKETTGTDLDWQPQSSNKKKFRSAIA